MSYVPLAEKMRPSRLDDVVGQSHLIGPGKIISEIVDSKRPTSLILWGPAGSGKTTLAQIIANGVDAVFVQISAVNSGKADVRKVIEDAKVNNRLGQRTVLFVDEIHRFNKAQQDAFLHSVEDGTITLIGATTENPSYEVINPLISRSRVLLLEALSDDDITKLIKRAAKQQKLTAKQLTAKSIKELVGVSGGDARVALGNLEMAISLSDGGVISPETIRLASQSEAVRYDKNGEQHYNVISAFIKSMRGSDPTATVYYLARMLQAGEDPKFIARRMVIFASEDVGLAAPAALNLAVSTFMAVERIGLPECEYNLFHCAVVLAKTNKSRAISDVMHKAKELASGHPDAPVPFHLQSKLTRSAKDKSIKASGKHNKSGYEDGFMPEELQGIELI